MKINLKTFILIGLFAFFVIIILLNFSNLEGFTAADSNVLSRNIISKATNITSNASPSVPTSTSTP